MRFILDYFAKQKILKEIEFELKMKRETTLRLAKEHAKEWSAFNQHQIDLYLDKETGLLTHEEYQKSLEEKRDHILKVDSIIEPILDRLDLAEDALRHLLRDAPGLDHIQLRIQYEAIKNKT